MKKRFTPRALASEEGYVTPHLLRGYALRGMCLLVLLSFASTNIQALLWQSSDWLVGAILPAVVVDLTNQERQALAAAPLQRNATLDAAATMKAKHMAEQGYFAHFSPTGVTPWHWFAEAGYSFVHAGENLAIHFSDSSEVVTAWMNSPTHRDNIVDQKYQEIGVGTARGTYQGYETIFVVQLFGAPALPPRPAPPAREPTPVVAVIETATPSETVSAEQVAGATEPATTAPASTTPATPATSSPATTSPAMLPASTASTDTLAAAHDESSIAPASATPTLTEPATAEATPDPVAPVPTSPSTEVAEVEVSDAMVSIYSGVMSSSTPLLPATLETTLAGNAGTSAPVLGRLATQPNTVLQVLYLLIGGLVGLALFASVLLEWRRHHPLQVAYGVLLLCLMSGLFYLHVALTSGATIA